MNDALTRNYASPASTITGSHDRCACFTKRGDYPLLRSQQIDDARGAD
jgi:hypothetical protein